MVVMDKRISPEEYARGYGWLTRLQFNRWEMSPESVSEVDVARLIKPSELIGGSYEEAIDYLNIALHLKQFGIEEC